MLHHGDRCTSPHSPERNVTQSILRKLLIFAAALFAVWLGSSAATALPIYSVVATRSCDTCHVEPLGWANPDLSERRCTVDCVGCHVSSAGGGMRLADGLYYGKEVLPMFGTRPSSFADPEKYRPKGFPKKGKYKLGEGFSGWWPGKTPHTDIDDRYGNIEPHPKWRLGGDFRAALLQQSSESLSDTFVFPMQADLYLLNESVEDLWLYVSGGLQGYKNTDTYGAEGTEAKDYFTIRELFLKYRIPYYNSYFRMGRFIPRYGWRTSDHTAFTRADLGFDQYYQAWGGDIGINPNYFYADASFYFQGLEAWPGERMRRGVGTTANIGWRDLGWQIGASFHYADLEGQPLEEENGDDGPRQTTAGINWGVNYHPLGYYGELDLRRIVLPGSEREPNTGLYALHELNYELTTGLYGKLKYDYGDSSLKFADTSKHRITIGFDLHPYTYIHLEALYRLNYAAVNPFTQIIPSSVNEFLLITHVWF